MANLWRAWKNRREYDSWANYNTEVDYGWLKRTIASIIIFTIVYGAHVSDTAVGKNVDTGIKYILNTQSDFGMTEKFDALLSKQFDVSILKKVQTTMTKPADPLMYMTKPAEGQLISRFGWQKDASRPNILSEGISIETMPGAGIRAGAPGKVKLISDSINYGKTMIIEHGEEIETVYGYLGEVLVGQGELVSQGQVIARAGKTGKDKAILYFEVRDKGKPIDPLTRIKGEFLSNDNMSRGERK